MTKIKGFITTILMTAFAIISFFQYGFNSLWITLMALFTLLTMLTIEDVESRKISVDKITAFSLLGIFLLIVNPNTPAIATLIAAVITFIVLWLISKVTHGAIGLGDIEVVGLIVLYMGTAKGLMVFVLAMMLSGILGIILLGFRKVSRKTEIPFLPFLLISFLCITFLVL